jgi:hypothetical protein
MVEIIELSKMEDGMPVITCYVCGTIIELITPPKYDNGNEEKTPYYECHNKHKNFVKVYSPVNGKPGKIVPYKRNLE